MTIDALIAGKLHARPEERTSKTGKPFATAKMRAAAGDGESLFVNIIAFDPAAVAALLALDAGDSLAVSGGLTPKVWTDREGTARPALDVVAHAVLTSYHVSRKRSAMQRQQEDDAGSPSAEDDFRGCTPGNIPARGNHAVNHRAGNYANRPKDAAWRAMAPAQQNPLDDGEPLPF